jgi:hypothetical protein
MQNVDAPEKAIDFEGEAIDDSVTSGPRTIAQ